MSFWLGLIAVYLAGVGGLLVGAATSFTDRSPRRDETAPILIGALAWPAALIVIFARWLTRHRS